MSRDESGPITHATCHDACECRKMPEGVPLPAEAATLQVELTYEELAACVAALRRDSKYWYLGDEMKIGRLADSLERMGSRP